jgi:uncharacterized iron-regulated membrane protein
MIRRIIGQIHLWAGLTLCMPFVLLGFTGSVLVFEDELNRVFGPAAGHLTAGGAARPASDIVAAARAVAPAGFVPIGYMAPAAAGELASVRLGPPGRAAPGVDMVRIIVDPVSLETIFEPQNGWLRQVFFLHSTLLMKNREGRQLVGGFGVVMLVMGARAASSIGGPAAASGAALSRYRREHAGSDCIANCMERRASGVLWCSLS